MFIAMNRFHVFPDQAEAFETVWRERDSALGEVPGLRRLPPAASTRGRGPRALRSRAEAMHL